MFPFMPGSGECRELICRGLVIHATAAHGKNKRCDRLHGDTIMNQIYNLYTTAKHGRGAAALFAVVFALATFTNAAAMPSAHSHKGKKGTLTITATTQVGGIILQPGDYRVRALNSPSGSVVEFVHLFDNFTAQEGLPVHDQEVVGQVKVTEQALSLPAKQTQLMLASWYSTDAIGLEIRGNAVGYVFAPSQMTVKPDAMAVSRNADAHE
jgi:hypothetical protein